MKAHTLLNTLYLFSVALLPNYTALAATKFYTNATLPANLNSQCAAALLSDVNCSPVVPNLYAGQFYPNTTLARACTADCAASLASYWGKVASSCTGQTWSGYGNETMPVLMIPEMLRYHYNLTCLTDNGRFCNNVAASLAANLDPGSIRTPENAPANGQYGNYNITDPCDLCLVKNLQFQAGSPYYNGPDLISSSIYMSKTSSCKLTGYPVTTTPLTIFTPTAPPVASPTCAGKTYQIKAGDDCHSISQSEGIGTVWLLADNNLTSSCVNFPTNGSLCLVNTCSVYTVKANDTCDGVAFARNITVPQLKAWNPNINAGCYNLDKMVGDQVCIGAPGPAYHAPPSTTLAPSIPLTPAPRPTDAANGTNTRCGQYYRAELGDYCNLLCIKFGISLPDFTFLNPDINANCTNLIADESYCVQAVGDLNTYSGRPGYQTYTLTGTVTGDPAAKLPDATETPAVRNVTRPPLAAGSRGDCYRWFNGSDYRIDLSKTQIKSHCALAAQVMGVSLEDLGVWNPSLGNTSLANCTFAANTRYCGKYYFGDKPIETIVDDPGLPIRDGTKKDCDEYVSVSEGSGWTCANILSVYKISIAQFYAWNPSVKSDCSGLWLGYRYCAVVSGGTTTTSASPTTTTGGVGAPTQTGQPADCNKWHVAQSGDSCAAIENQYLITHAQFLSWNPSVSQDCSTGFWAGYGYCVGRASVGTSTRATTTSAPAVTSTPAPEPNQPNNAVSNCNKYAKAESGDYCELFAQKNSITLQQLYAWNAVLGSDGSGCSSKFWAGYYYCVGVKT